MVGPSNRAAADQRDIRVWSRSDNLSAVHPPRETRAQAVQMVEHPQARETFRREQEHSEQYYCVDACAVLLILPHGERDPGDDDGANDGAQQAIHATDQDHDHNRDGNVEREVRRRRGCQEEDI